MSIIGCKNNIDLYDNLYKYLIPNKIEIYVEPFGGDFGLYEIMENKPKFSIYNDINIESYEKIKNKYRFDNSIFCFNKDYKEIIYNYNTENTFFSCDPPYLDKFYYKYNFTKNDHIELSKIIKKLKGEFLLSYQDRTLMRELYNGYNFYKYTGNDIFHKPEIAITNY